MPTGLQSLRSAIRALVESNNGRARFRERVVAARSEYFKMADAHEAFQRRRIEYAAGQGEPSGPRAEDWSLDGIPIDGKVRGCWFPPGLRAVDAPPDTCNFPEYLNAFTPTLALKYALLAAIHDADPETIEMIDPWRRLERETTIEAEWFAGLVRWARTLGVDADDDDAGKRLGAWVADVRDDLNVSPTARLLGALADADERGRALVDLPRELLDPKLLHDCDALGWIEFGNRDSIFLNTEHGKRRELGTGWRFGRRTIPGYKQMPDIINEALRDEAEDPDVKAYPDLRTHVRVTAAGRTELARLRMNLAASVQPATAGDAKPEAAGGGTRSRQRRNRRHVEQAGLTLLQTEAVQIVGACKGNIAEAARRLGKDRKTVKQHYEAGLRKLGRAAPGKPKTQRLATDRRGQVSESHDRRLD